MNIFVPLLRICGLFLLLLTGFAWHIATRNDPERTIDPILITLVAAAAGMMTARKWGAIALILIALGMWYGLISDWMRSYIWEMLLIVLLLPLIPVIVTCGAWKNLKW